MRHKIFARLCGHKDDFSSLKPINKACELLAFYSKNLMQGKTWRDKKKKAKKRFA